MTRPRESEVLFQAIDYVDFLAFATVSKIVKIAFFVCKSSFMFPQISFQIVQSL